MADKPTQNSFSVIVTNEHNSVVEQQPVSQQISVKKSKKSVVSFEFQAKEQEGIQEQETNELKNIMLGETHPIGRASIRGRNSIKRRAEYNEDEEYIDILKKQYRTPQEIQFIEEKTKDLRFFQQINKVAANQKAQLHKRISKCLGFDYFPKGRVVFYQGDLSDAFFVLLKGNALVLLKENLKQSANSSSVLAALNKKLMIPGSSQQMTSPLMKMLRLRLMHKLVWRLINILRFIRFSAIRRHHNKNRKSMNFDGLKKSRRSQVELQSKQPQLFGAFGVKQYAQERFTKLRKDILANVHPELDILYLENIQRFFDKQLQFFQYSASKTVEKGDSFGELGLINSKPRSATIVCLQDCYFASLSKSQYSETLREVEKHQIYKRVMFLYETLLPAQKKIENMENDQNIENKTGESFQKEMTETVSIQPFFETKIQKIQVNFSKCRLQAGQIMITQGKPIEMIYIIKKGEVSCSVQQQIEDGRTENIHIALLQRCEIVGADEILLMLEAKGNQGIVHDNLMAAQEDDNEDGENTQRVVPAYQSRRVEAFCTAKVKSLYCSALCVSSLDFRRILEDFPEMRIHLTRRAKTKLRWIEIRKKESIKLQMKLKQKRIANSSNHLVANPSHIIRDSSMMKLLSTTSLLHKTFYLKEKKQSPILPQRQLTSQTKQKQLPQELNSVQQNVSKSKKSQKELEVKKLVRKYFSRELSQRTNKTLNPRIETNEIVEEGLALKYGYIHSLSSTKLSPSQVVDFIFNHSENNNQEAIISRAEVTHQPISQVIADLESGAINIEKEKHIHEKVSSTREVKVDYTTLGYSDEVIKRMVTRQSQTISAQNYLFYQSANPNNTEKQVVSSGSPLKQSFTPGQTVQLAHNPHHQRYFSEFKTKNSRVSQNMTNYNNNLLNSSNSLHNNGQQLSPQNYLTEQLSGGKLSFSQQTSLRKSTSQLKLQYNEPSSGSLRRVTGKKLSLSLEPQELEKKNKLNKRIISQTLHMNKPREMYYAQSFELHKPSNSMTNFNNCSLEQQPPNHAKPTRRRQSCFASPLPTLNRQQDSQQSNLKSSPAQLNSQLSPLSSHRSSKSISSKQSRESSNEIQSNMLPMTSSEILKPLRKTISHEGPAQMHPFKQLKKSRSTSKGKLEWSSQSIERVSSEQNVKESNFNHTSGNNQRILEFSNSHIFSTNSLNSNKNTGKSLQLFSPFTEIDTHQSSDDRHKSAVDISVTFKIEQGKQQPSCAISEPSSQQKRFSQFFKNSNDSNKSKLSEILKKFTGNQTSTASTSSNLPKIPQYIDCNLHHQVSSSKELNIHLMRKKAETKSLLWQPNKQFYSNTNTTSFANSTSIPNQYENEPIFSKISPSFKKCFSQKPANDQSADADSQQRNTSQSVISHSDACTNTQATSISEQKYLSPEKIVILNHMGYPMSFILGGNTQQRVSPQKITMVKSHNRSIIKSLLPEVARSKLQTDTSFSGSSFIQGHKL